MTPCTAWSEASATCAASWPACGHRFIAFIRVQSVLGQLSLISDLPQQPVTPLRVRLRLDPLRRASINHSENPSPLLRHRNDHFHRMRRRAENRAHFRNLANPPEYVDRIPVPYRDHENMPGRERLRIARGILLQLRIVAV